MSPSSAAASGRLPSPLPEASEAGVTSDAVFEALDKNGDGVIDRKEWEDATAGKNGADGAATKGQQHRALGATTGALGEALSGRQPVTEYG